LRRLLQAHSVDDTTIRRTITIHASRHDELFCPRTATAMHELDRLRDAGDSRYWAVVATAHPAKFESVVEPLIGRLVEAPTILANMLARPATAQSMAANDQALFDWLRNA
jgi:threonine synthase